jgi:membrane-associated protease RseP (regulator of RpoE activity)
MAARSFNINVKEFSVGVGPKLIGFRRNVETGKITFGDSDDDVDTDSADNSMKEQSYDEIEFNLRAIPLGGYVRFPENYNTTEEFTLEVQADKKREEITRTIKEQRRAEAGSSGILASITNIVESYTNQEKMKEERLLALETMAADLNNKENKKSNNGSTSFFTNLFNNNKKKKEIKNERSIIIEEDGTVSTPPIEYYEDPNLLQNRGPGQRAVVLAGGVIFNILLAFTLYFGELTVGGGMVRPSFDQGAVVSSVPRADGASAGILNRGDVILALNGQRLTTTSPSVYKSQEAISEFISKIRETTPGDALHLSVMNYQTKAISEIDIAPKPLSADDPNSPLSIGVMIGPNFKGQETIKAANVIDAVSIASSEITESTAQTAKGILTYLGTLLQGKSGAATGQSLSGPIGVIKAGSDVVSTNNISAVIGFAAAISINLAVVNALPLPALDGGQMLFVIAEVVTKRKIDQRVQESINSFALLFLLAVTFSTAVGDISKIAVK